MPSEPCGSVTDFFAKLRSGDRAAAGKLWEHFFPRMLAVARKCLGNCDVGGSDAEDAAQSAFISFWQRAERGDFTRDMHRNELWNLLGVITFRKAAKFLEREQAAKRGGGNVRRESSLPGTDSQLQRLDDALSPLPAPECDLQLEELLLLLDQDLRSVALLRLMSYTNREIADILAYSQRKVERKLNLIRLIWQGQLDD